MHLAMVERYLYSKPYKAMIKKELSITELFAVLSVVALSISVLSNAFFYYSLDALWVMSILSPTFYIFEIIKVTVILFAAIAVVGGLIALYKFLLKKWQILKPKARYRLNIHGDNLELKQSVKSSEKRFEVGQIVFITIVTTIGAVTLFHFKWIGYTSVLWCAVLVGSILAFLTDHKIHKDQSLKIIVFTIIALFATCYSAQLKLNGIQNSPVAFLKSPDKNTWYVLDGFQDKVILLSQAENKSNIKVVKFDEIDRISPIN
ncbi:hypothetical protein ACPR111641_13500 [Acinetobacter pragensis]